MFVLQKNPLILATAEAAREKIEWARQRLADASAGLTFDPGEHRYFLGGRELQCVSSVVEGFAPFDTEAKAKRCSTNPRHPLFGHSPEEIMEIWAKKRDDAAAAGTHVHAFGEACCSFLLGREDEIDPEFRDRITSEGLVATLPKEESMARWWSEYDWSRYAVVAKETKVVNPDLRYAGTFDLLLLDLVEDAFCQKDYKTNEDLDKSYGDKCLPPLDCVLGADDIGKYTIQQTLYTIQLRNIGFNVISNELIWLREECYETRNLRMDLDRIISYAVRNRAIN